MMGRLAFERLPVAARCAVVLALFGAILAADYVTGWDVSLRALYFFPVALAAWGVGARAGALMTVLSIAATVYFDSKVLGMRAHPAFLVSDGVIRAIVYLLAAFVVVRLRAAMTSLRELAQTDPLTGLFNRRGFEAAAVRELGLASRESSACSIMVIDLDGFKAINDTLGHRVGDEVLVAVAGVLKMGRTTDVAARLGGDEFALLLPRAAAEAVPGVAERVLAALGDAMRGHDWGVTFSIGVATIRGGAASFAAVIAVADALMYEAKRSKDGVIRYREVESHG